MSTTTLATTLGSLEQKRSQLVSMVRLNEEQVQQVFNTINRTMIRDMRADPRRMKFLSAPRSADATAHALFLELYGNKGSTTFRINPHALSQMGAKVDFPMGSYGKRLNVDSEDDWRRGLLAENLNILFGYTVFTQKKKGLPPQFLLRVVEDEARGFLTLSFARHLDSRVLLDAFIQGCASVGAVPASAWATPVKYTVTAYLPTVYEPAPLSYVAFGIRWTTSDFGAGQMQLSPVILFLNAKTSSAVLETGLSRRHIGARLQDEDDDIELSDSTVLKAVEAERSRIRDVITAKLSPDAIKKYLQLVKRAHDESIPWSALQGMLANVLSDEEKDILKDCLDHGFSELPSPGRNTKGELEPSKMWTASMLSWFAAKCDDPERRAELEAAAGLQIDSVRKDVEK